MSGYDIDYYYHYFNGGYIMKKIIVFGSTTGNTESVANLISETLGDAPAVNVTDVDVADIKAADLVLFGSSTWGYGDLQDDWEGFIDNLNSEVLSGKNVAVFGCGDEASFEDVFCQATDTIKAKAVECGATIVAENLRIDDDPAASKDEIIAFAKQFA